MNLYVVVAPRPYAFAVVQNGKFGEGFVLPRNLPAQFNARTHSTSNKPCFEALHPGQMNDPFKSAAFREAVKRASEPSDEARELLLEWRKQIVGRYSGPSAALLAQTDAYLSRTPSSPAEPERNETLAPK